MVKASELREMSLEELQEAQRRYSRELFDLRSDSMGAKKTGKHRIRQARKDRARVLTVLTQKQSDKESGR